MAKPCSDLQLLSQKENYALFTLAGMKANLIHLKKLTLPNPGLVSSIEHAIHFIERDIKTTQFIRKNSRNHKTNKDKQL